MIQVKVIRNPRILVVFIISVLLASSVFVMIVNPSRENDIDSTTLGFDGDLSGNELLGSEGGYPWPADTTIFPWPMHLYDETHRGFTQSPVPNSNSVLWLNSTGYLTFGSPAVAEGKVFIGARTGMGDYMFAFYQDNGTLAWRTKTIQNVNQGDGGLSSSPAYSNGYLVYGGDRIYCVWANNGTIKWTVPTGNLNWGDGTPTIADGKVFIGGSNRRAYAIDLETGTVLWTFQTLATGGNNYGLYAAPAVYNGHVYVAGCDGWLYQIRIDQPGPIAAANHSFFTGYAMYGSPVIFDDKVYIGNGYQVPSTARRFYALDATDLSEVWQFYPGAATSFLSSAAIAYDKLFIGSVDGNLYVLDPYGSGGSTTVLWQYPIGSTWSSPAISSGQVFIGSKTDFVYAFDVDQTGPPTPKWTYNTNGNVDSSPAISDGKLYIGTHGGGGRIYAFGQGGDVVSPIPRSYSPTGTGVPPTSNFQVEWSEEMNWASVEVSFSYTDGFTVWTSSDGMFSHDPQTNTSTFDPSVDLDFSTTYWVTFSSVAVDLAGNPLDGNGDGTGGDDLVWSFTTVIDNPPVLNLWEPGGTAGQSHLAGATVPIVWEASDDYSWPNAGNVVNLSYGPSPFGGTSIAQLEFDDGIYTWDTTGVLPGDYYINITVYDSLNQISGSYSNFSFEISSMPDIPPTVSILTPSGGEVWSGGSSMDITWDMEDDITPTQNLIVYLNYSFGGGPGTIAGPLTGLTPPYVLPWTLPFIDGTDVVVIAEVIDESGGVGSNSSAQFEIDSTAPIVSVHTPFHGQTNVPTNTLLNVDWSEGMNTTATESSFLLSDNTTWTPVLGTFSWDPGSVAMSFDPDVDLLPNSWYTANFSIAAKDDSEPGNNLALLYSWSFMTSIASDIIPPEITHVEASPDPQEVFGDVRINATITDSFGIAEAHVELYDSMWTLIGNFSMSYDIITSSWIHPYPSDTLGAYACLVSARDNNGNWNITNPPPSTCMFNIVDTTLPAISNIQEDPDPQEVFGNVNISASVVDNYQLLDVSISIPSVGGFPMSFDSGNGRFYFDNQYDILGSYDFWIFANDTSYNQATHQGSFDIVDNTPPDISSPSDIPDPVEIFNSINISAVVTDNYALSSVRVDIQSIGNYTMQYSTSTGRFYHGHTCMMLGSHDYTIWAVDSSGNWNSFPGQFDTSDSEPPQISHSSPPQVEVGSAIDFEATVTDNHLVDSVWLNYTDVLGNHLNVSMSDMGNDEYQLTLPVQTQVGQVVYHIVAVDHAGNAASTPTLTVTVFEDDNVPLPPYGLTAERGSDGDSTDLSWQEPTLNEDLSPLTDLAGFHVYRSDSESGVKTRLNQVMIETTYFVDVDVSTGGTYYYWVTAVDESGNESDYSALAKITFTSEGVHWLPVHILLVVIVVLFVTLLLVLLARRRKEPPVVEEVPEEAIVVVEESAEQFAEED